VHAIELTVTDAGGLAATQAFTVTVTKTAHEKEEEEETSCFSSSLALLLLELLSLQKASLETITISEVNQT
jgi:hypothetical protein